MGQIRNKGTCEFFLAQSNEEAVSAILVSNFRKTAASLSFDVELTADTDSLPRILELLNSYSLKATFASIGMLIEKQPRKYAQVLEAGHEIMNHSYSHPDNPETAPNRFFNKLSQKEQFEEVQKFDEVCKKLLDYQPKGFRTPHYAVLHTDYVYEILKQLNYSYSSSVSVWRAKRSLPFFNEFGFLELPTAVCPKHFMTVFDSWHTVARANAPHTKPGEFLALFKKVFDYGLKYGAYSCYYFDPRSVVALKDFEQSLEFLSQNKSSAWIDTCEKIADWWKRDAKA
ncbi:MAG: polysaccharide deacetylase family protein [Candidatus Micrarchaeia archaeon]